MSLPIRRPRPASAPRRRPSRQDAEAGDHLAQFLPGGDVADADLAQMRQVEQGQSLGEEFAIDDAFAKARNDAETDAPRQFVQRQPDAAHVVRCDVLQAVAQDDPVHRLAGGLGALRRLFQISSL
jgi:hypothetical protein